ncbi:MBL fold metallo-hydrolase [Saccharomonospora cyanea]|uniref:Zn-dependent hydrolase, glyoxylase n=1 Tax=Saccharomonospora cyanea NA-134 TaxID=882082 RepID=H5XE77_9PSEU|nr:MBL fold metallo-hydrolase [Saccharomonospora cyanea]EHR60323.1 Zn-dependent hydrolase, glyoxylase [Saccharomonospora cyanea NA-134]
MNARWIELGDGVFTRRYEELDLSTGLVLGEQRCLVVDTRGDAEQGAELAAAVRGITPLPWTVVLTHDHFDHAYGVPAFLPCDVWAHPACWAELVRADRAARAGLPVTDRVELDLGGRPVVLAHPGVAHSPGDVVVHVPDADVLFAGDLLEHVPGGTYSAESFGSDTALDAWPAALERLAAFGATTVVPGHGEPAGPDLVESCREGLLALRGLRRKVRAGELTEEQAVAHSPLPADVTLAALTKPPA